MTRRLPYSKAQGKEDRPVFSQVQSLDHIIYINIYVQNQDFKGVLHKRWFENFAICWSASFNKIADLQPTTFFKKDSDTGILL